MKIRQIPTVANLIFKSSITFIAANLDFKLIFTVIIITLIVWGLISMNSCSPTYEERQAARDEKINRLELESKSWEEKANAKDGQIQLLNDRLKELGEINQSLRQALNDIQAERSSIKRTYAIKRNEVEKITDADELRRSNCLERSKLGYPCPD